MWICLMGFSLGGRGTFRFLGREVSELGEKLRRISPLRY